MNQLLYMHFEALQETVGETDLKAILDEDVFETIRKDIMNMQVEHTELQNDFSKIYNSISDLIPLNYNPVSNLSTLPMSQSSFCEYTGEIRRFLQEKIQKVYAFEGKKEEIDAENLMLGIFQQMEEIGGVRDLKYTNPMLGQLSQYGKFSDVVQEVSSQLRAVEEAEKLVNLGETSELTQEEEEELNILLDLIGYTDLENIYNDIKNGEIGWDTLFSLLCLLPVGKVAKVVKTPKYLKVLLDKILGSGTSTIKTGKTYVRTASEKIKDIEMPDFGVGKQLSFAGVGSYKESKTLGDLFSTKKTDSGNGRTVKNDKDVDGKGESGSKVDTVSEGGTDAIQIGKTDLDALRNKLGVPETDTIAVGKTDVKGLEGVTFEGQSPKVRSEAGLPDLDEIWAGRNIKSPGNNPLFTRHAEEVLANDFDRAVIEAGINPQDVSGVLKIHQSNPTGVCRKCIQGLANDNVSPGVLKQLSLKYPNLRIEVTSEILPDVKVTGKSNFIIQNGQYEE